MMLVTNGASSGITSIRSKASTDAMYTGFGGIANRNFSKTLQFTLGRESDAVEAFESASSFWNKCSMMTEFGTRRVPKPFLCGGEQGFDLIYLVLDRPQENLDQIPLIQILAVVLRWRRVAAPVALALVVLRLCAVGLRRRRRAFHPAAAGCADALLLRCSGLQRRWWA